MTWTIAGLNFDHGHMYALLSEAFEHPDVELVGLCDWNRERSMRDIAESAAEFGVDDGNLYEEPERCLEETDPDIAILCPATGERADLVETVAAHGAHVLLEKPFAASLEAADRMRDAVAHADKRLAINWPLAWYPTHRTTKRLLEEDRIGDVIELQYYDGNSGSPCPGEHPFRTEGTGTGSDYRDEPGGWFYDSGLGGGALLDYLGYGVTLGTWFRDGELPEEVTTTTDSPDGLEVDEHSVTVARYESGLSTYQTRWGMFGDPWELEVQPRTGFVLVGTEGTIASYDYDQSVRVQTESEPEGYEVPVDTLESPHGSPVEQFIHALDSGEPLLGPLTPELNRKGQQIVEAAQQSAREDRSVKVE